MEKREKNTGDKKNRMGTFLGLLSKFLFSSFCAGDRPVVPQPLKLGVAMKLTLDNEMSVE